MKIGLEFEGVIRSRQTGEIARWSKMSGQTKRRIKNIMFPRMEAPDPCDRYDVLAEVRTEPIENPTPKDLIWALFSEMEKASNAFTNNGYDIQWFEQPIPQSLHDEIKTEFATDDPDGKKGKLTFSVRENGERYEYVSEGNLFRGGGLHINISHVPFPLARGLMEWIHNGLKHYKKEYNFQSHYRTNFLYRNRYADKAVRIGEPIICIAEYMSHGFNVPSLIGWHKRWNKNFEKVDHGYRCDMDMGWAFELIELTNYYFKSAGNMK